MYQHCPDVQDSSEVSQMQNVIQALVVSLDEKFTSLQEVLKNSTALSQNS